MYHHFECATYLYDTDCIPDIEADFQATRQLCSTVTMESAKQEKFSRKAAGILMKAMAPLM